MKITTLFTDNFTNLHCNKSSMYMYCTEAILGYFVVLAQKGRGVLNIFEM